MSLRGSPLTVEAPKGKTSLRLETWSDTIRVLWLSGLSGDIPFSFDHVTKGDRSLKVEDFALSEHNLVVPDMLSVQPKMPSIFSFNGVIPVRRGQCYARVTLLFRGKQIGILSSAYVTDAKGIAYPPGVHEGFAEGPGYVYAATTEISEITKEIEGIVPENARWRVRSLKFRFDTSGVVADRGVKLKVMSGAHYYYPVSDVVKQKADFNVHYSAVLGGDARVGVVDPNYVSLKLPDIILVGGDKIGTWTSGIQVDDVWYAVCLFVEEWIEE